MEMQGRTDVLLNEIGQKPEPLRNVAVIETDNEEKQNKTTKSFIISTLLGYVGSFFEI